MKKLLILLISLVSPCQSAIRSEHLPVQKVPYDLIVSQALALPPLPFSLPAWTPNPYIVRGLIRVIDVSGYSLKQIKVHTIEERVYCDGILNKTALGFKVGIIRVRRNRNPILFHESDVAEPNNGFITPEMIELMINSVKGIK